MAWAPDYCSTAELKSYVGISDTDDDAELALAITAASRAIDTYCSGALPRQFGQVSPAEARSYTARWSRDRCVWMVDIDDLGTTSGLLIDVTDQPGIVTATFEPLNAVLRGGVWTRMVVSEDSAVQPTGAHGEVVVTALWGWTAVPTAVKQAALLQASRIFKRKDAPFGVAGSPELGSEMRLLARVDPDVAVILTGYRRTGGVG